MTHPFWKNKIYKNGEESDMQEGRDQPTVS